MEDGIQEIYTLVGEHPEVFGRDYDPGKIDHFV